MKLIAQAENEPVVTTPDGAQRRILSYGGEMMLVQFTFDADATSWHHSHPHEQLGYVASGEIDFVMDGQETVRLKAGGSYYVPSNVKHHIVDLRADRADRCVHAGARGFFGEGRQVDQGLGTRRRGLTCDPCLPDPLSLIHPERAHDHRTQTTPDHQRDHRRPGGVTAPIARDAHRAGCAAPGRARSARPPADDLHALPPVRAHRRAAQLRARPLRQAHACSRAPSSR